MLFARDEGSTQNEKGHTIATLTLSSSGTEEPGLNPERVYGFLEVIAMLLCTVDLVCIVCVERQK
jgi:hypothetical protein